MSSEMSPAEVEQAMGEVRAVLDEPPEPWQLWCDHEPVCLDEESCDRLACDFCTPERMCLEHRSQARAESAAQAAERSRS